LAGKLLFLHANFRPKFSLDLPAEFAAYTRRWQVAQPGKAPFVDLMAATGIGPEVDFEHEVYNVSLRSIITVNGFLAAELCSLGISACFTRAPLQVPVFRANAVPTRSHQLQTVVCMSAGARSHALRIVAS